MNRINEIIEFDFGALSWQNSARNIISTALNNRLNKHVATLNAVNNMLGNYSFRFTNNNLIPNTYRKVKSILTSKQSINDIIERRELRTLTFALNYSENNQSSLFSNSNDLKLVLNAVNNNWRDSFIIGLFDCYVKNWDTKNKISKELLGVFIGKKLNTYEGNRTVLKSLKTNQKYFVHSNGDVVLGAEIALKGLSVSQSTKYLSLPDSYFNCPYFSMVIVTYYEKKKKKIAEFTDELNIVLQIHNSSKTNKRLISKLIIQANMNEYESLQEIVKIMALKYIGDPNISSNWLPFENASETEINELKFARNILNQWITRRFISVFFERCINDKRRKKFWLKYADKISTFKVFGSSYTKRILKLDNRIAEFVDARYQVVDGGKDISAFMFLLNDYKLIEFSDPGYAFYAYKNSNRNAPSFDNRNIYSIDSFRDGTKPMLVYRSGYHLHSFSEEGRLSHLDGGYSWEVVFSKWISKIIGINV